MGTSTGSRVLDSPLAEALEMIRGKGGDITRRWLRLTAAPFKVVTSMAAATYRELLSRMTARWGSTYGCVAHRGESRRHLSAGATVQECQPSPLVHKQLGIVWSARA